MFPNQARNGNMNIIDLSLRSMNDIHEKLKLFEPITLEEMDGVRLLDRLDTKYTFSLKKLPELLEQMKDDYRILEINGLRIALYETRYFDTHDFRLYLHHHNGKLNRYKIRFRKYTDSNITFFEIKLKNSKGRMIKKRVQVDDIADTIQGSAEELLLKKIQHLPSEFRPVLNVNYSRMTFVNRNSEERLTIDTGLNYNSFTGKLSFPHLVIAETKQAKSATSPFFSLMHRHHVRQLSISKYCLGIANLVNGIKKNNFKFKINQLNKTDHGIR
jgi:hypothetical protein